MNHHAPARHALRFLAGCLALATLSAWACSVPVFRYALEHWASDPYEMLVLHRGPLSAADQKLVSSLGDAGSLHANVSVRTVDLAQEPAPEMLGLWREAGSPATPWLVVRQPKTMRQPGHVWSGPLNEADSRAVLDSPARRAIAERLGEGESAVWIFLESGDKAQDDAAAKLLEARLAYLSTVMELPKLDEQDVKNGLVSPPEDGLRLAFSLLRVSRTDPAEKAFVQMLLATEKDLKERTEPMAFPIFGQARVLYALIGAGIKHDTIDEAASFLIGSCSCQVKEQNPGADLLMTVDWKGLIKAQSSIVGDLPTVRDIVGTMPETVTISARSNAMEAPGAACCGVETTSMRTLVPAGVLAALGVALVCWLALRKKNAGNGSAEAEKPTDEG